MSRPLVLEDILDLRAYERVRDEFRQRVIARKRLRRVPLGPVVTLVFECEETIRFQVQEMARVEKIATDEGILGELAVYNRLLPGDGELSATLFIELTSDALMREWLPKLVGIETHVCLEVRDRAGSFVVRSVPEAEHAASLTRDSVTPAVHYLRFAFTPAQAPRLAGAEVELFSDHPAYEHRSALSTETVAELATDLA
jgi:hypothetical protein